MSKQLGRQPAKQTKVERRREEQRQRAEQQLRAARQKRVVLIGSILGAVLLIGAVAWLVYLVSHQGSSTANSASNTTAVNANYPPVNGVTCDSSEQLVYHVHAHLSIYIDGQPVSLPQNLGIAPDGSCFYWLHTHDTSGVIHIETPGKNAYSLGTFFDIWELRFPSLQYPDALSHTGWQAYVNGKPYTGDFRQIPLEAHALITLAYNSPGITPDTTYNWGTL